jgi:2-amino-4-hydroxy-6-hydroxymethyldihydropteridine diphosphokinase
MPQVGIALSAPDLGSNHEETPVLFFDDIEIHTKELQIPHPLIQDRQFVLIPMAEIDRNLIHPVFKKTVRELLDNFKEDQGVEKL